MLLLTTPLALMDPAMLLLILDPEVVALFVLVGIAAVRDSMLRFVGYDIVRRLDGLVRRRASSK